MTCQEARNHVDACAPMTSTEEEEPVTEHIAGCRRGLNVIPRFAWNTPLIDAADTSAIKPAAPENTATESLCLQA